MKSSGIPSEQPVANKRRICYFALMAVRSCRVTIQNLEGVAHTVEVTAESLYEAVAQGLARHYDAAIGFTDFSKASLRFPSRMCGWSIRSRWRISRNGWRSQVQTHREK